VDISSVTFSPDHGTDDYTRVNHCPKLLLGGQTCQITVNFYAGTSRTSTATLNVNDNASPSPQQVGLTANVINPRASFNPAALRFGTVPVGQSSTKDVTLTNTGTTALDITSISITGADMGDYTQQSGACPSSLNPGDDCVISVTFAPSATGTRSASLTVLDNAAISTQNVGLSGRGSN